jgi:hypothetical protein
MEGEISIPTDMQILAEIQVIRKMINAYLTIKLTSEERKEFEKLVNTGQNIIEE